ncbi:MAG: nicotinamide riboside transporter PnuC [Schleiferiaceae bacterium]|nr:nicotinamide riboside transporter PnuC [Schleiferiaceae bacterium]
MEFFSVIFNILFVFGVAKQKIWAWPSGMLGCGLAVWMFYSGALYAEAFLNIIYSLLAIYGWVSWRGTNSVFIIRLAKRRGFGFDSFYITLYFLFLGCLVGAIMDLYTDNPLPYIDCIIAAMSILATIWQARKILDNWYIWMVLNSASIFIFINRDFNIYAVYSFMLFIMSIWGYKKWDKYLSSY